MRRKWYYSFVGIGGEVPPKRIVTEVAGVYIVLIYGALLNMPRVRNLNVGLEALLVPIHPLMFPLIGYAESFPIGFRRGFISVSLIAVWAVTIKYILITPFLPPPRGLFGEVGKYVILALFLYLPAWSAGSMLYIIDEREHALSQKTVATAE